MRNILLLLLVFGLSQLIDAQVPNGFNFQSIIRDNSGKALQTKNVSIRFSILKGSSTGSIVYSEEHHSLTNEFGLVNVLIGYGYPLQGRFDQVDWSNGNYYLKTEIDPNGGLNYELSGVSPFVSVPFALYADKTRLEAGPGILIEGNKITNTGDTNPDDDLKVGSTASGDLSGILSAPKVIGLQGRAIGDISPAFQQALIWNGSQWIPGNVDTDPTNDITINSIATGDLSGTYPNPKVLKLNGYPLNTTTPDSGDVLVFSQGEWKHFPISTSPSSSDWKRVGNDIQLQDPINVKQILTGTASVITQNRLISTKGTDSAYVSPIGLNVNKLSGTNKISLNANAESIEINRNYDLLMGLNVFGTNAYYTEMELWNLDPSYKATALYINPYQIQFGMKTPDRFSNLTANEFDIYRKTTDSPLQYAGIEVRDSSLYYYNGKSDYIGLEADRNLGGAFFLYDKDGKDRMHFSTLLADQTQPYIGLFSTKTNSVVAELLGSSSTGELYLGNSSKLNVYAGYSTAGINYPFISVIGPDGSDYAGMYLNTYNQGVVFGDIKSFRMQDPEKSDQEIWYACVEGPEAAAYERGTAKLSGGEIFVAYSEHFMKVCNLSTATVQLTSGSSETFGLAVIEKNDNGFKVKELQNGKGNFSFDWEVKAVRKGYESYEVYHKKQSLRPDHPAIQTKASSGSHERSFNDKKEVKH